MYRLVTLPSDTLDAVATFVSIAIFFVLFVVIGEIITTNRKPKRRK